MKYQDVNASALWRLSASRNSVGDTSTISSTNETLRCHRHFCDMDLLCETPQSSNMCVYLDTSLFSKECVGGGWLAMCNT